MVLKKKNRCDWFDLWFIWKFHWTYPNWTCHNTYHIFLPHHPFWFYHSRPFKYIFTLWFFIFILLKHIKNIDLSPSFFFYLFLFRLYLQLSSISKSPTGTKAAKSPQSKSSNGDLFFCLKSKPPLSISLPLMDDDLISFSYSLKARPHLASPRSGLS